MRPPWEVNQLPRAVHDPATIAYAAIGTSVLGGLSSAGAQAQQAQQAQMVGSWNQQIAERQAQQLEAETRLRADMTSRENQRKIAQTRAAYGAAGVEPTGTVLDVLQDQATELELQRQLGIYSGTSNAAAIRMRGALAGAQGSAAAEAGYTAAGTTLLTTAANAGMNLYTLGSIPGKSPYPVSPASSAFPPGTRPVYS